MWFPICKLVECTDCYEGHILGIRVCCLEPELSGKKFWVADISIDTLGAYKVDLSNLVSQEYELFNGEWISMVDGSKIPEITDMGRLGSILVGDSRITALVDRGFKVGYLSKAVLDVPGREFVLEFKNYEITQGSAIKTNSSEYCTSRHEDEVTFMWSRYDVVVVNPGGIAILGSARLEPTSKSKKGRCVGTSRYTYDMLEDFACCNSEHIPRDKSDGSYGFKWGTDDERELIQEELDKLLSLGFLGVATVGLCLVE